MAMNNNYKIDLLNGENYVAWQRRLEWILDDLDLWAITNGTEPEPQPIDPWAVTQVERMALTSAKRPQSCKYTSWRMRPSAARQRRFAPGEVSLRSPSTQGRGLAMLVLDARANPRYAWLRCKSEPSLCSASMQGRTLAMLAFHPRVHPHCLYPSCKRKVSLPSPSTQGQG